MASSDFAAKQSRLTKIHHALLKVALHLKNYLPIANAHMTDFIAKDWWALMLLPQIQEDLLHLEDVKLSMLPSGKLFSRKINPDEYILDESEDLIICGTKNNVLLGQKPKWDQSLLPTWQHNSLEDFIQACQGCSLPHIGILSDFRDNVGTDADITRITEFMSAKKSHEVEIMAELCASLAKQHGLNIMVDVGSGKGYLGSHLALKHHLCILGIDSSSTNTEGAAGRSDRLRKQWQGLVSRAEDGSKKKQRRKSKVKTSPMNAREQGHIIAEEFQPQKGDVSLNNSGNLLLNSTHELLEVKPSRLSDLPESDKRSEECVIATELVLEANPNVVGSQNIISQLTEETRATAKINKMGQFVPVTKFVDKSTNIQDLFKTHLHLSDQMSLHNSETNLKSKILRSEFKSAELTSIDAAISDPSIPSYSIESSKFAVNYMMGGLHACGDLTSNTLRLFLANGEAQVLCNVGCCYHHLTEAFISCPYGRSDDVAIQEAGFPLSRFLQDRGCQLGRNARMLAAQAPDRIADSGKMPGECHYWRGLLQVILRDLTGELRNDWIVGKIAAKCSDFKTYVNKALAKLGFAQKLTDAEIKEYQERYSDYERKISCFFQLKAALAPCIEALILLDRAAYLLEQENVNDVNLIQAFDPVKSPRCYALIACKR